MKKLVFILLTAVMVAFTSCINEAENPTIPPSGNEVSLTLTTPGKFEAGLTRAQLPQADEEEISSATIIVFKGAYDYHKTSTSITHSGGNVNVKVNLRTDNATYDLLVLTNLSDYLTDAQITAALTGATIDNAYQKIQMAALTKDGWDQSKFVMSGVSRGITLSPTIATMGPFYLMRSLASMDIGLKWDGAAKVWTGLDNFELEEVYVYNANADYTVLPKTSAYEDNTYKKVVQPTIYKFSTTTDDTASSIGNTATSALHYDSSNITIAGTAFNNTGSGQHLASKIYLSEVKNDDLLMNRSDRPAVIVKGAFKGKSYYYRLDFTTKDGGGNYKMIDILRNHKYRFSIINVQGPGHETPDDAFNSSSLNMEAEVLDWDDGDMENIVFDKRYFLAVNKGIFEVDRDSKTVAGSSNTLIVRTDVPAGWSATLWADEAGITPVSNDLATGQPWLSLSVNSGTGGGSGDKVALLMPFNKSGGRTAWVHIKAERLNYKVKVTQTLIAPFYLDILSPSESILEIPPAVGLTLPPINVNIEWEPYGRPVSWEIKKVNATGVSFPTTSGTIPAQGVGPGVSTITLQPESMLAADIDPALGGDIYAERISRLEVRLENENGELIVRNAVIKQTNYHIKATPAAHYIMNGRSYSLTVFSNCDWEAVLLTTDAVASVDQSVHTGSKLGTALNFTMANQAIATAQSIIEIRPLNSSLSPIQVTIKGVNGLVYKHGDVDYLAEYNNRTRTWSSGSPNQPCPAGYSIPIVSHYQALDFTYNLPSVRLGSSIYYESKGSTNWCMMTTSWNTNTNAIEAVIVATAGFEYYYAYWRVGTDALSNLVIELYDRQVLEESPKAYLYIVYGDGSRGHAYGINTSNDRMNAALAAGGYTDYYSEFVGNQMYTIHHESTSKYSSGWMYGSDQVRCVTKL